MPDEQQQQIDDHDREAKREDEPTESRSEAKRERAPGFRCDDPDSLTDCEGHEVGAIYDGVDSTYDRSTYGE